MPNACIEHRQTNDPCSDWDWQCFSYCEPIPTGTWANLEEGCVIFLTFDIALRLLLAHRVRWELLEDKVIIDIIDRAGRARSQILSLDTAASSLTIFDENLKDIVSGGLRPRGNPLWETLYYQMQPATMIDTLAVFPYWFEDWCFNPDGSARNFTALAAMRTLRCFRVLRFFRLGRQSRVMRLFYKVMKRSMIAFRILVVLMLVACAMFSTLIWFSERGQWMPAGHPYLEEMGIEGRTAFLRTVSIGTPKEDDAPFVPEFQESPFRSIPHSMWWVMMTFTTVGYGDVAPTQHVSFLIFLFAIAAGVSLIALPIGIIGNNFNEEFDLMINERRLRATATLKRKRRARRAITRMAKNNASLITSLGMDGKDAPVALKTSDLPNRATDGLVDTMLKTRKAAVRPNLDNMVASVTASTRAAVTLSRRIPDDDIAAYVQQESIRAVLSECDRRAHFSGDVPY
jgi:hypothetical protein